MSGTVAMRKYFLKKLFLGNAEENKEIFRTVEFCKKSQEKCNNKIAHFCIAIALGLKAKQSRAFIEEKLCEKFSHFLKREKSIFELKIDSIILIMKELSSLSRLKLMSRLQLSAIEYLSVIHVTA